MDVMTLFFYGVMAINFFNQNLCVLKETNGHILVLVDFSGMDHKI